MKERFRKNGARGFSSHELLELSLYYVMPRVNTNELAHNLIDKFGSLRNVINADPHLIESLPGCGKETSTFFMLISEIKKRMELEKYEFDTFYANTLSTVGNFLVNYYKDRPREEVCAMLLDNSFKLLEFLPLSSGSTDHADINITEFTRYAIVNDATQVIIAHNHPGGSAAPSAHDRNITLRLFGNLEAAGIDLIEHIIVNDIAFTPTLYMTAIESRNPDRAKKYKHFYSN